MAQSRSASAAKAAKLAKSAKPAKPAKRKASAAPTPSPALPAAAKKATDKPKPAAKTAPAAAKKPKLVRDSFTIPKDEYAAIGTMKARAEKLGRPAKKSELLRAGLAAIAVLADAAFIAALNAVPTIKTGRPQKSKHSKAAA